MLSWLHTYVLAYLHAWVLMFLTCLPTSVFARLACLCASQETFLVFQDFLKTSSSVTIFRLSRRLQDLFKTCLHYLFQKCPQDVFKTSSQNVFKRSPKTSLRCLPDVFATRLPQGLFKRSLRRRLAIMSWRHLGRQKNAGAHLGECPGDPDPCPFLVQSKLCPQILKPI